MSSLAFAQAVDTWREIHSMWVDEIERKYVEAENFTRGHLLSKRGKEVGVDAKTLLYGNERRAYLYASDELIDYFETHGRLPYQHFEAAMIGEREHVCSACGGVEDNVA